MSNNSDFIKTNKHLNDAKTKSHAIRFLRRLIRILLYTFVIVTLLAVGIFTYYNATLYKAGAEQEGYLALNGATVLVGEDLEAHRDTTVLIRDGIIIEVGDDNDVVIYPEATVLDLSGYTLMPGLIDLHVHLGSPELKVGQRPGIMMIPKLVVDWVRFVPGTRRAFLDHGVTTVRSLGDEYGWIMDFRRQLQDGYLEGPRLFAAGPVFTTLGGHPIVTFGVDPTSDSVRLPTTPDEARRAVREITNGDDGVDLIKVIQERGDPERLSLEPISLDVLQAIVDEAHDRDLPVTAHWGTLEDLEDVLVAGVDGLEHLEARGTLEGWPEGILDLLVKRDMPLSPTLAITHAAHPPQTHQQLQQRLKEFHAAGGRIVVGSDSPMQGVPFGVGVHLELELLVKSGLTPQEALKATTSEAAKVLRIDSIGAIEPGRAADLVVIDGDPLRDIQTTRNVVMVFRDGRLVVEAY